MGQRERDRLKTLHEVVAGYLTQRHAAEHLKMRERGFRKLLKKFRSLGDRAVVHGLRGKPSPRLVEAKVAKRVVRLVQAEYGDFGPTLAAEYLGKQHHIYLSRETMRRLLIEAGQWEAKPRKLKPVHIWRQRRSCRGELVQWDTSVHAWLEERVRESCTWWR